MNNASAEQEIAALRQRIINLEHANTALQYDLQLFQSVIDTLPFSLFWKDRHSTIIGCNQAFATAVGYNTTIEVLGKTGNDLPTEAIAYQADDHETLEQNMPTYNRITSLTDTNGTQLWLETNKAPLQGRHGETIGVVDTVQDITQNKLSERLLNSVASHVYVYNIVKQTNVWANSDLTAMMGYTLADLQAFGDALLANLLHADDLAQIPTWQTQIMQLEDGQIFEYEYRMRRSDGEWIWLMDRTVVFTRDADGQVIEYLGTVQDITALKMAEVDRVSLQQHIINAQRDALSELSTPLIPLADGVIIMPLIGTIDPERALQVMETLLDGIGQYQADIAILDITGVRTIDTQVASALVRTAQAARLLGAQVMLSGISAEVAQTLVHLGADLGDITTQSNLHSSLMEVFGTDMRRDNSTSLFTV